MGMEQYKLETHPKSNPKAIIQGDKYRITILTNALVRLEYSESGIFEDRPTQTVLNRDFPVPEFTVKELEEELIIYTSDFQLHYDRKPFSKNGLWIRPNGRVTGEWGYADHRYGWPALDNFGGTTRTLDGADGEIPVEPGLMSPRGTTFLDDSKSMLLTEDGFVAPREHEEIDMYWFAHRHDFLQCLKDFYRLCGKTPLLPRYAMGNWWSRFHRYTQDEYIKLVERFEREKLPFTVAVVDSDWHIKDDVPEEYGCGYTGYSWNREFFPDPEGFMKWLHEHNMKVTLNVHPNDGIRAFEDPYREVAEAMGIDPESKQTILFDPTDKKFLEVYFQVLNRYHEKQGVDFWWIDWQQGDVTKVPGLDPLWMLNHYHYMDSKSSGKRPITFSRYAGVGSHRYPIGFSGDSVVTWESLDFQPYFTNMASNIGYGWWSHDIGGHMMGYRDDELATRWLQLGVFSPINRLHSTDSPFNGKEPWNFNRDSCAVMSKFLRLRHQMIPYLYTMNRRASRDDMPIVLPMYFHHPELMKDLLFLKQMKNQYYFGSELLVLPITKPMEKDVVMACARIWLPKGKWVDFFNGMVYSGERFMNMWRILDEMPVFLKAGGIVPMQDSDVFTNSTENPAKMEVKVFPIENGEFTLWEDEGDTAEDLDENWASTKMEVKKGEQDMFVIRKAEGNLSVIPEKRSWKLVFAGIQNTDVKVNVAAKAVYDKEKTTLTVHIPDVSVEEEICVIFTDGAKEAQNDVVERGFEVLFRAQTGYDMKYGAYNLLKKHGKAALPEIVAFEDALSKNVVGALIEVLTAQ